MVWNNIIPRPFYQDCSVTDLTKNIDYYYEYKGVKFMGNDISDAERLAKLETKLGTIEVVLARLEAKLDKKEDGYMTKDVLDEKLKLRDEKIEGLANRIHDLLEGQKTNKQLMPAWVQTVIAAAAVLVAMATSYRQMKG